MIIYKNQSLLDITEGIILHGCNCFCAMGAGVAKVLKDKYPYVATVDNKTVIGDMEKLGTYSEAKINDLLTVLNCYTQYYYSSKTPQINYTALQDCFLKVKKMFPGRELFMPKIGCGLAGGGWSKVESMINSIFDDRIVYIYYIDQGK